MNKLLMCRICLVENVRMYVITDEHLQEIYEKLTDFPFETGDGRPLHACLFCITKLKQCCQLLKKCLDAEKLFDQMVCKDYRPDTSLQYLGQLEFFGGLTTTPVEHISILEGWHDSEDDDELGTDDDELGIDGDELAVDGDELAVNDNDASDGCASPDKVDIKDEHCDEDIKKIEVKLQNFDKQLCDEQEEQLSLGAPVAKKPALSERGANVEDTITSRQRKNQLAGSKVVPETRNHTSKPVTKVKRPSKKSNLQKHIGKHTGEKPYACNVCQRSFRIKYLLDSHILIHTGEKPYKCDICQHNFRLKRSLYSHIRIHTGEKPYKCKQCQRSFRQITHLKHHALTHTSEKPNVCDICHRGFTTKSNLQTHYRVHTGEKPHKCDECQRSFKTKWILKHHVLTHTGEKPYKCEICQRSFSRKANLENHSLIHNDKKQYQCEICAKFFSQASTLNGHLRVHKKEGKVGAGGAVLLK